VRADIPDIVALVNEVPITKYDFLARKKMLIILNNIDTKKIAEFEQQLNNDVLKILIEEELLKQHAGKVGGSVDEKELNNAISTIESRNNMVSGELVHYMSNRGVDINSFREQLKAEIIKNNIASSLSQGVQVSNRQVDDAIIDNTNQDFSVEYLVFTFKDDSDASLAALNKLHKLLNQKKEFKDGYKHSLLTNTESRKENYSQLDSLSKSIIRDTTERTASPAFQDNNQWKMIFVKEKTINTISQQDEDKVKNFVFYKQVSKRADKFINDLRRKAFIEVKF
jgi:parvulin-like peptidyl-prolyl isomerase